MRLHQRRILANCLRMELYRRSHPGALAGGAAAELWGRYAGELFQVDAWYRQLVCDLTRCVRRPPVSSGDDLGGELVAALDEAIRALAASAERLYKGWFLEGLGSAWSSAVQGDLARLGHVDGAPQLGGFFAEEVEPLLGRGAGPVVVIISDALRYEVAHELAAARAPDARHLRALRPRGPLPLDHEPGHGVAAPARPARARTACCASAWGRAAAGTCPPRSWASRHGAT